MMPRNREADFSIDFETAGWSEETKRGGTKRVGGREDDAAVVGALAVGCGGRAAEGEVPFEEIGFEGSGVKGWVWVGLQFGGFFEDAFYGGGFGVEGWEGHD